MEECPDLVLKPEVRICSLQNTNNSIYAMSGLELRNCLKTIPKALLYIWKPNCMSEACVSPLYLQKLCDEQNLELFIVAEYFDCESMQLNNILERPIFGVDQDYYNTNLTSKNRTKFWNDLTNSEDQVKREMFCLFEYGIPKASKSHFEDVLSLKD